MKCHLYRHYDAKGALLYVGISLSALARLGQHKQCSHWFDQIAAITIEHFATRADALLAESEAIRKERPLYNVAQSNRQKETAIAEKLPVKKFQPIHVSDSVQRAQDAANRLKQLGRERRQIQRLLERPRLAERMMK